MRMAEAMRRKDISIKMNTTSRATIACNSMIKGIQGSLTNNLYQQT